MTFQIFEQNSDHMRVNNSAKMKMNGVHTVSWHLFTQKQSNMISYPTLWYLVHFLQKNLSNFEKLKETKKWQLFWLYCCQFLLKKSISFKCTSAKTEREIEKEQKAEKVTRNKFSKVRILNTSKLLWKFFWFLAHHFKITFYLKQSSTHFICVEDFEDSIFTLLAN